MHEVLHIIGLCPDSMAHFDLLDLIVANNPIIGYVNVINFQNLKYNVIKRLRGRTATSNKR
jgi:hypothetical protein